MTARVGIAVYFGLWAAIAAGLVYVATCAGYSFGFSAVLTYVLFALTNGSLAYVFRARQLKREGKQPPSFLMYVFLPQGLRQNVAVPRPLRLILGIVVLLGGAFVSIAGGLTLANLDFLRMPHPIGALAMLLLLAILGPAFLYVGLRVIIVKNEEPLFKSHQSSTSHIDAA